MREPSKAQQLLRRRGPLLWPLAALLILGVFAYGSCTVYVQPGQYGVKQVIVGSGQGMQPTIYSPGLHFLTPGVERMHVMPAELQVLEMSDVSGSGHKPMTNVRQVP